MLLHKPPCACEAPAGHAQSRVRNNTPVPGGTEVVVALPEVCQLGALGSSGTDASVPNEPEVLASRSRRVVGVADPNDEVEDWMFLEDDDPEVPPDQVPDLPAPEPEVAARSAKPRRHPGDPTKAEMDAHNLTHANYRSWCSICNRAALG